MNDKFKKLKTRAQLFAVLKSLITGAAAALFVTGVTLLVCRLSGVNLFAYWYVLISLGVLLAGAGIAFAFFRVTDKKLARELDNTVGRERVQTALAYQTSEGDIYELQRGDAAERLAGVKPAFTRLWLFILLPVLAFSILLGGALVKTANAADAPDDPYQNTDWQKSSLSDLILYVRKSGADDETKVGITTELLKLVNLENLGITGSSLEPFVLDEIAAIRSVYTTVNGSYPTGEAETEEIKAQKRTNSEVGEYVVQQLYVIYDIQGSLIPDDKPTGGDGTGDTGDNGDGTGGEGGDHTGSRELFFDPELGYVFYDVVSKEYHDVIDKAMDDGVVSSDEWFDIIMLYFQILDGVR
ncbi:MAG: hypothetical protein K2L67_05045 [Clostridia bacterium]|nr:hypothetical protein [Clostridia bacterium]